MQKSTAIIDDKNNYSNVIIMLGTLVGCNETFIFNSNQLILTTKYNNMKYVLAIITGLLVWIITFIIMSPYLIMSCRFKELQNVHNDWWEDFTDYINNI